MIYFAICPVLLIATLACSCADKKDDPEAVYIPVPADSLYYRGVDLSYLSEMEEAGIEFRDEQSNPVDVVTYMSSQGYKLVRLRLWHTPAHGKSSLDEVRTLASRARQAGMDLMLDIHYSDTFADPAHQTIPAAWKNADFDALSDSIFHYTRRVMETLKNADILPAIVQIGNETNAGFLWNQGRVGGTYENNWENYKILVSRASSAIRLVDTEKKVKIMMHVAGFNAPDWYFGKLKEFGVDYDLIGLSYYSIWHGKDLAEIENKIRNLGTKYGKRVMIAETAYPWTLEWNDWTNNIWGLEEQLIPGYPATPEGQKSFLLKLDEILSKSGNMGCGFCYWAPDYVAFDGPQSTNGSVWENATFFDFSNQALPACSAFNE